MKVYVSLIIHEAQNGDTDETYVNVGQVFSTLKKAREAIVNTVGVYEYLHGCEVTLHRDDYEGESYRLENARDIYHLEIIPRDIN